MEREKRKLLNYCIYCILGLLVLSNISDLSSFTRVLQSRDFCPNPKYFPRKSPSLAPHCGKTILSENFEGDVDAWINGDLSERQEKILVGSNDGSKYLHVFNREYQWQGPTRHLNELLRECITNENYIFRVDIRMSTANNATVPKCFKSANYCPELLFCYQGYNNGKNRKEKLKCKRMSKFKWRESSNNGEWWFWEDLKLKIFPFVKGGQLFKDGSKSWLSITGPEPEVDISIDNLQILSKSGASFPEASSVCEQLITNGNNAFDDVSPHPFKPMPHYDNLIVKSDDSGNYLHMSNRSYGWSSPSIDLVPGCLRNNAQYKFTGMVKVNDEVATRSRVLLRFKYQTTRLYDVIAECPESSNSIGWVQCEGVLQVKKSRHVYPPFTVTFVTDSKAPTDWRNMVMTPLACGDESNAGDKCPMLVSVSIDAKYEGVELDINNGTTSFTAQSAYYQGNANPGTHLSRRKFELELPDASKWNARFKVGTQEIWPRFAEVSYNKQSHCEGVENTLDITRSTSDAGVSGLGVDNPNCNELLRADFDSCTDGPGSISMCDWYGTSGPLKLTTDTYSGTNALSTNGRAEYTDGMLQYFDDRCMVINDQFTVFARFRLVDSNGNGVVCNPSSDFGSNSCPRGSIRTYVNGIPTFYLVAFARTAVPIASDGWGIMHGSFIVDSDMIDADAVAFQIEGPDADLDIVIDSISITPYEHIDLSTNPRGGCVRNWDFEIGDSRNWECVGKHNECSLQMIQPGYGGSNFALASTKRQEGWWGIDQEVDMDCFSNATTYEINARTKLVNYNYTLVDCDPYNYYQGLPTYCPNILLQNPDDDRFRVRAAATVGPHINGWNHIYGVVTTTEAMLSWPSMIVYVGWSGANLNIVIDEISIKPADENTYGILDCNQLVRNGDAEIGDARFWYIRGSGENHTVTETSGQIAIVTGDTDNPSKFFHHVGTRAKMRHGMWQELDMSCMAANSRWKISAKFRLLDANGNGKVCSKLILGGPSALGEYGCPIFRIEVYNGAGGAFYSNHLYNEDVTPWNPNGWNSYENTFLVDDQLKARERFFIFVHGVMPSDSYMIDDVTVTPVTV